MTADLLTRIDALATDVHTLAVRVAFDALMPDDECDFDYADGSYLTQNGLTSDSTFRAFHQVHGTLDDGGPCCQASNDDWLIDRLIPYASTVVGSYDGWTIYDIRHFVAFSPPEPPDRASQLGLSEWEEGYMFTPEWRDQLVGDAD